ncbi:uncharacterized protein LOC129753566 [Uranotaenia lowii]|uniref:uncharacterized protein LOC129753566 n=1 Tax=Uranotaenia lowii TaxID=190385 RepID=UPI00247A1D32|nr:uncharacterized protein LOC129753566 [Uranotaenia lowii]
MKTVNSSTIPVLSSIWQMQQMRHSEEITPLARDQESEPRYGPSYGYPGDQSQPTRDDLRRSQNHQYRQQQSNARALRLIWDEKSHTLEYILRYNSTRPGFWISSGPQVGSMVQMPYVQFTGTVQVLKAINNQLVLTFCQSLPGGQLFSVVLSRQPMSLSAEENQAIRNLLKRRLLSTTSVRKVCYNGTSRIFQPKISSLIPSAILILLSLLMFRKN